MTAPYPASTAYYTLRQGSSRLAFDCASANPSKGNGSATNVAARAVDKLMKFLSTGNPLWFYSFPLLDKFMWVKAGSHPKRTQPSPRARENEDIEKCWNAQGFVKTPESIKPATISREHLQSKSSVRPVFFHDVQARLVSFQQKRGETAFYVESS